MTLNCVRRRVRELTDRKDPKGECNDTMKGHPNSVVLADRTQNCQVRRFEQVVNQAVSVSQKHHRCQVRVNSELQALRGSVKALLGKWDVMERPRTALHKWYTLKAYQGLETDVDVKKMVSKWRVEAALIPPRRAEVASPTDMRIVAKLETDLGKKTCLFLWLSASRHGDLERVTRITRIRQDAVCVQWNAQKSDRYGERRITKFVFWPWKVPEAWSSYRQTLALMKHIRPELTVHSLRRGAMTTLADLGHEMKEIGELSGHAPTEDPNLGVRRYIEPSIHQPQGRRQLQMSRELYEKIYGCQDSRTSSW